MLALLRTAGRTGAERTCGCCGGCGVVLARRCAAACAAPRTTTASAWSSATRAGCGCTRAATGESRVPTLSGGSGEALRCARQGRVAERAGEGKTRCRAVCCLGVCRIPDDVDVPPGFQCEACKAQGAAGEPPHVPTPPPAAAPASPPPPGAPDAAQPQEAAAPATPGPGDDAAPQQAAAAVLAEPQGEDVPAAGAAMDVT